ncbi:unnamed protein product [Adineta ricciae]|uniref:Uncharacterized protein n=1 Tax=Adineta ricciae TaxID=249248 RepID=A0A813R8Q9_ADIRI|nr:unnamed protein product [Adineta ricciae]
MRISLFLHYIVIVTINTLGLTETCNSAYYSLTKCLDKLDHYECLCRQGHLWNGYLCVADAVDSRLVFNSSHTPTYIELDSKPFPRISELTISFWIRLWTKTDSSHHTILYYKTDESLPVLLVSIIENARLHVEILNHVYDVSISLILNEWQHIAIAHHLSGSKEISIRINGSPVVTLISTRILPHGRRKQTTISGGGDFFVGQTARPRNVTRMSTAGDIEFDHKQAFRGEISYLNLWQKILTDYELDQLAGDCHRQKQACGDAVSWMDFVNDIKGEVKIHWPSGISELFDNCPTQQWLRESCDNYCRKLDGPHCKNESQLSITWPKSVAGRNVTEPCPGNAKNGTLHRTCQRIEQIARWTHVDYDQCIHPLIKKIDRELDSITSDKEYILALRDRSAYLAETISTNLTATELYSSIDLILLIEQIERLTNILISHFDSLTQWYTSSYEPYYLADVNATLSIHQYLLETISNLIDEKYQSFWNETHPSGNDFVRLLSSLQRLTLTVAQVLTTDNEQFPGSSLHTSTVNIEQSVDIVTRQQLNSFSYENVPINTKVSFAHTRKTMLNNRTLLIFDEKTNGSTWYSVIITTFRTAHLYIPNLRLGRISKYDNLNSHVISIDVKLRKPIQQSNRLSTLVPMDHHVPVLITTGYLNHDNISGNQCVYLDTIDAFTNGKYKATLTQQWKWQSLASICEMIPSSRTDQTSCSCFISNGTFAVTSDMFDPKWRAPESRLYLFGRFSYIGSFIHISFALLTLIMLNYLRTHSSAAYIHKHYAFVLICAQVILILAFNGIPLSNSYLCRAVACTAHFFILSSYCWLMNEAFNLYIQITYSTHPAVAGASATLSEAASKYRFLGMGYILPFCIVTLLASIKTKTYFMATKLGLCFIDLDDWFKIYFIPITGIIFITIMVMIFSAKQHHESSYTKNEKANEVIVTYTGGIWSQLFLITVSWSLAILPYFYDESILQLLHGFFSGLQGGFLFLSFFLFNDEIRRHYRDRRRQLRRIQLMEIPYRNSITESDGQRTSIVVPAVSSHLAVGKAASLATVQSTKVTSVASVVSNLLNRNRSCSTRNCSYDEMKWTLRNQSSEEVISNTHVVKNIKGNTKTFVVKDMADEQDLFRSLTDEDKELFNSYKEAVGIQIHEAFPDIPANVDLRPTSIRQQLGCGTFYTYKVILPDNQNLEISFHLGGKRVTPLVGPPHFQITKIN